MVSQLAAIVIGAGSVVNKSVDSDVVCAGDPARVIKLIDRKWK